MAINPITGASIMIKKITSILLATVTLASCAGRAPAPIALIQATDRYTNCAAIMAEIQINNGKISDLGREEGGKVAQNVLAGAAGIVTGGLLWFAMDFQGAAGKEIAAIQGRQLYLATLAESKRCSEDPSLANPPAPTAPKNDTPAK